ncbi:DUF6612 family protein [Halorhabdus sp. CUG00001]|uniref:DUF6612 family protein n=1 Tax=Halorhabdus sp. CUG00001 TaxID=2600297 RepID=UPI00131B3A37|nr:DUF6612 family protein [Halorhabdus sp. CUG00001]
MRRSTLALVALAGILVLAGCSGGGTTTATSPDQPTDEPTASQLQQQAITAISDVAAYHAQQNATIRQQANNLNRSSTLDIDYQVDRTARSLESHRTAVQSGREVVVDRYIVEKTLYQRSEQFASVYGSEWVKNDLSDNFTRQWHLSDQLWRYKFMLGNASLSNVTTDTVDGSETYVVTADVNMEEFNAALNEQLNLPENASQTTSGNTTISATFWIDTETHRPVKVERAVSGTQTVQGQTIEFEREVETMIQYDAVSISLPDEAEDAVDIANQ